MYSLSSWTLFGTNHGIGCPAVHGCLRKSRSCHSRTLPTARSLIDGNSISIELECFRIHRVHGRVNGAFLMSFFRKGLWRLSRSARYHSDHCFRFCLASLFSSDSGFSAASSLERASCNKSWARHGIGWDGMNLWFE